MKHILAALEMRA